MQKKKLLEKIVRKDYNNELEKILETKDFDEDVKSLLLGILYKIDDSYKDYKTVKRDVETKQQYIERIIETVKNECNEIKITRPNTEEKDELNGKTFLVDKNNKKIICYPVERKLLYAISKINKNEEIIRPNNFLINETLSSTINIGNSIQTVEPLRDFNGWSWMIIKKEIESISHNLIYQNLRILLGEKFINNWIKNTEYVIDYYDEFKTNLIEKFGEENALQIIELLEKLSIILEIETNKEFKSKLIKLKNENKKELKKFENNQEFIEEITKKKKQINKKIKKIEKILANKELFEKEFKIASEKLPIKEKILSKQVFEENLRKERIDLLEDLDEKNQLLNPIKFVGEKTKLEKRQEIFKINQKQKNEMIEKLQNIFLKCYLIYIQKAQTKEEIVDLIYIFRYYNLLPFNEDIDIYQNKYLQELLSKVEEELIKQAIKLKAINTLSENLEDDIELIKFIFRTRIITLEDIYITIAKNKEKYYIEFSENNEKAFEEKFEVLTPEKLKIKLNKRTKLFS